MTTPTTPTTILTDDIRARRVAVARDVIARIEAGKLTLTTGNYLSENPDANPDVETVLDIRELVELGGDLQPHVDRVEAHCEVCALGAVLLSKARVMDAVPVGVLRHAIQSNFHHALADVFDVDTLHAIESAFERNDFGWSDLVRGAVKFGHGFDDDAERCMAVMEKIVEGNGELAIPGMTEEEYDAWDSGDDDDDDDDLYDDDDLEGDDDDLDTSPSQMEPV